MALKGIITGCGKGIGLACAKDILENIDGSFVLGLSRSKTRDLEILIQKYPSRFIFKEADLSQDSELSKSLDCSEIKSGIDFVIGNAGMRSRKSIELCSLQTYRDVIEMNTISQINLFKQTLMLKKTDSSLRYLFVSSIVGQRGFSELSSYAASKSALEGFVKSAAVEYGSKNILINCIAPGFVESSYADNFKTTKSDLYEWTLNQKPMKRWGKCEEVAALMTFLVSKQNTYMTGSVIPCDGGWMA